MKLIYLRILFNLYIAENLFFYPVFSRRNFLPSQTREKAQKNFQAKPVSSRSELIRCIYRLFLPDFMMLIFALKLIFESVRNSNFESFRMPCHARRQLL